MFRLFLIIGLLFANEVRSQVDTAYKYDTASRIVNTELDEVVISGTLRSIRKMESSVNVEVYSSHFLKHNPVPSIFEALQMINGIRPQLNCNICSTGDIRINGLEGPYTMITIDGMPIVSGLSSVYGLFGIPNEMIERIELIKGPASGLYGSEAVGGLINIITKSAKNAPKFSANVMSTSWNEFQGDLTASIKNKKHHSLLGLHFFQYDNPLDKNHDGFTDLTLQKRISVFNKWKWERRFNRIAETGIRFYHEDRWGGQMQWNKLFKGSDSLYGESILTNRFEWIGKYQLPIRENITLSWSYIKHLQDSYYGIVPFMADQRIAFSQLIWMKEIGKHNLLAGAAIRYTFFDDNTAATRNPTTGNNQPDKIVLPGVFFQEEWKMSSKQTFLLGLRYDYHTQHKNILTPRIAWKWSVKDDLVFRINSGTGFRVVNIFTEDHAALTGARQVEIKERIRPEKSWNINVNSQKRWFMSKKSQMTLDASIWYTRFSNRILPDYDTDPNKIIYSNLNGHSVSKGFSVAMNWNLSDIFRGMIGTTIQDVYQINNELVKTRPVLTEKWSGVWNLGYTITKVNITMDYTGNLYSPMRLPLLGDLDPRPQYSPIWSIQNIQLTKRTGQFELIAGIKNILNWTPARNLPFLIARSTDPFDKRVEYDVQGQIKATPDNPYALTFDPTYSYAPNQARRFFVGIRYKIP